jgi:predicted metal-dependent HD superfamily phosphohydrolase
MNADMRQWWLTDAGPGRASFAVFDALVDRYREPHRRYHSVRHVTFVRRDVAELLAIEPVPDPIAVRLAAWYHDAIYDPRSGTNEADSAALAQSDLSALGQRADRIAAVERLILATAAHEPSAPDEAVLLDADLAVLAAEPRAYDAYVAGVRFEYRFVDDDGWRVGRSAVLQRFLDRPRIFRTTAKAADEHRARANLAAELASLRVGEQPR